MLRQATIWTGALTALETGGHMLQWALAFLILTLVAAFFGFAGVAVASAGIAKILFYIFVIIFAVTLLAGVLEGGRATR
jgi:uncharacterized membrane protein YtjA (UPF0391 family)